MAVPVIAKLVTSTVELTESGYEALVRESEQLRIIKNFVGLEDVYGVTQVQMLIKAMEVKTNE